MENFLKIYIQKIQQNLKAVAFLTIQFFRERADFSTTKKNKPQRIFNDAISNRILNRISSTIILLRKQFLWAQVEILGSRCHLCSILQFVCHDYQFSFLSSKVSKWQKLLFWFSVFTFYTNCVTKRFTRRWHIFFLVLIDLWFVAL